MDEAIAQYQKALEINPNDAEAHYNLGIALLQKGQVDEAMVQFQKALEINPNYAEAHNNLGLVLFQKGQVDEAIAQYQKALEINPDYAAAHYNLGNALLQKGQLDEAIAQFQKALEINPDYAEAHINLGCSLSKGATGRSDCPIPKGPGNQPQLCHAHYNLGWLSFKRGNWTRLWPNSKRRWKSTPTLRQPTITSAMLCFKKDKWMRRLPVSKRRGNQPVLCAAHSNLGVAFFQKGQLDEAVVQYQQALEINPNSLKSTTISAMPF